MRNRDTDSQIEEIENYFSFAKYIDCLVRLIAAS